MERFEIRTKFIDPLILNEILHHETIDGIVIDKNEAIFNNKTFQIINSTLLPKQHVKLFLDNNKLYCSLITASTNKLNNKDKELKEYSQSLIELSKITKAHYFSITDKFDITQYDAQGILFHYNSILKQTSKLTHEHKIAKIQSSSKTNIDHLFIKINASLDTEIYFREKLQDFFPYKFHTEYAYSPNENINSKGKDHLILEEPIKARKLIRNLNDPLCKTANKFNNLQNVYNSNVSCEKCIQKMITIIGNNNVKNCKLY